MNYRHLIGAATAICLTTSVAYFAVSPIAKERVAERRAASLDARKAAPSTEDTSIITQEHTTEGASPAQAPDALVTNTQNTHKAAIEAPSSVPVPKPTVSGYTLADVAKHADASSCWTAIEGNVYDLTPFVSQHKGGERTILKLCGTDGTTAFEAKHGGKSKPEQTLATLYIGPLIK